MVIGDHNVIREGVTINRGTEKEDGVTTLGSHCFIMAGCHIAHDCRVGSRVIMANATLLGGHVHVHDDATISGGVAVHHFSTIGSFSFTGGLSRVLHDVPPYMLADGNPSRPRCINIVALKRNDFSADAIRALAEAHRLIYRAKVGLDHARELLRGGDLLVPRGQSPAELPAEPARRPQRPRPRPPEGRVSKLRLAVIGVGHLGKIHARLLAAGRRTRSWSASSIRSPRPARPSPPS